MKKSTKKNETYTLGIDAAVNQQSSTTVAVVQEISWDLDVIASSHTVIALTFFALLFISKSLLFFTISRPYPYSYIPATVHSFLFPLSPFSHESRTRRNGPRPSDNDSLLVHAYWYCYCYENLRRPGRPARRSSHELRSLVISALPRRA